MSHELEIKKLEDRHVVQFRVDQTVFTVDVDKHGRPQFTESVVDKVPRYMRNLLQNILMEMRFGPIQMRKCVYVDADHQEWCAEAKGHGNCNRDPVLHLVYEPDEPKLFYWYEGSREH